MKFNLVLLYFLTFAFSFCSQKNNYTKEKLIVKDERFYEFIDKEVVVEKVASGYRFTEGPVYNYKENYLLFSDIPANTIYRLKNGNSSVFKKPSQNSNGLTYAPDGLLVVCEQFLKQVAAFDEKMNKVSLTNGFKGKSFNSPNDIAFKKDGSFFFSDPPYGHLQYNSSKTREMDYTGVYYVRKDQITLIDSSLVRANGLTLSPDEKKLYVVQSEFKWLFKEYNLNDEGKVLSSRVLFEGEEIFANLDGIKTDTEGNLYATGNGGVMILTPEGKYLGTVRLPENPANLCFGDKDLQSIYVTANTGIYKFRVKKKGWFWY